MARFIPVVLIGLTALGLFIGDVSPAWWITGLVALGLAIVIWSGTSVSLGGRSVRVAPYLPAVFISLAAAGLLIAGVSPAWWIAALVAVGFALVIFMAKHS
jgi:hypothetical protein